MSGKTMRIGVGAGTSDDRMVPAVDLARYGDLDQAFAYRTKVVPSCTCNGKDAFGLVQVDVMTDPTLQAGDIVATADGLKAFQGAPGETHRTADFAPAAKSYRLSRDLRDRLSRLRVSDKR